MNFKLESNKRTIESIESEAMHLIYLDKIKRINKLRKQNKKKSEQQYKALQSYAGSRTNANHKSDMAIRQNNMEIRELEESLETIDKKYNINFWEEIPIMQTKNKKYLDEYKEWR